MGGQYNFDSEHINWEHIVDESQDLPLRLQDGGPRHGPEDRVASI